LIWEEWAIFLAFANQSDQQIELVQNALKQRGHKLLLLDTATYPDQISFQFTYGQDHPPQIHIKAQGYFLSAEDIAAVWVRRYNGAFSNARHFDQAARDFTNGEAQMMVNALPLLWPDSSPWISKPGLINRACNKPYNLMIAQNLGFRIPDTAFTNHLEEAVSFLERHDPVAMKTLSALWIRSNQPPENEEPKSKPKIKGLEHSDEETVGLTVFYVKKYASQQLLDGIGAVPSCPVIFQAYVNKALELRVTVIGQRVFSCAIYSQEDTDNAEDYRVHWTYNLRLEVFELPPEIEKRCLALVQALGLEIGCIDLILTPEGEYVYLEINPVGQWIWIEERTGMPIAEAIADLLIEKGQSR